MIPPEHSPKPPARAEADQGADVLARDTPAQSDLQDRADTSAAAQNTASLQSAADASAPNRTGIPDDLKANAEAMGGVSLDNVRVTYNSSEPAKIDAHAFARGAEIHVAPGQTHHMPEEVWHSVQQARGEVKATGQINGMALNDDPKLEREAISMGAKAQRSGKAAQRKSKTPAKVPRPPAQRAVVQRSSDDAEAAQGQQEVNDIVARTMADAWRAIEHAKAQPAGGGASRSMDTAPDRPVAVSEDEAPGAVLRNSIYRPTDADPEPGEMEFFTYLDGEETRYVIAISDLDRMRDQARRAGMTYKYRPPGFQPAGQVAQRAAKASAALAPVAPRTSAVAGFKANKADFLFHTANAKSSGVRAEAKNLNRQPKGTPVGTTRPKDYTKFIAMTGGNNYFVQGHLIHQDLSGEGWSENLAPFTRSLNGVHLHAVEKHVLHQTDGAQLDQFANYDVRATYGANAAIFTAAKSGYGAYIRGFDNMTLASQVTAMVVAGLLKPAQAAGALGGASLAVALKTKAHGWMKSYADSAFPVSITCKVNFIDRIGGTPKGTGWQTVTITNEF